MNDHYFQEDLTILKNSSIPLEELRNSICLVTGATGLIGSQLVRALVNFDANITVIALIRNEEKARSIYGELTNKIVFVKADITSPISWEGNVDYIIHCASVTTSKIMVSRPVETLVTAIDGTKNILEFARTKGVKSMVYVSSMEMYGTFDEAGYEVREENLGYVDPLKVRSNYPESKRLCENMCVAYLSEYFVPVKIARLSQTFGAGVLKGENRVFAQFARSVIRGENIVLHTEGLSEGNYCYTRDAVKALLILLIKGADGEAYNISNPETHTTIADMAYMVANKIAEGRIKVIFEIPEANKYGYASDVKMKLNSDKMQALGWIPEVGLEEAYRRLIGSLIETNNYL